MPIAGWIRAPASLSMMTLQECGEPASGHSKKTVRSKHGDIMLDIPRDRKGEFAPVIVKKHQKSEIGTRETQGRVSAADGRSLERDITIAR